MLSSLSPKIPKKSPQRSKIDLGVFGENIAVDYLRRKGFQILDRNWHATYGEIDIVAKKSHVIVCVEVKTRIGNAFGEPEDAITPKKLHDLTQLIEMYVLEKCRITPEIRIDVIAIGLDSNHTVTAIRHHENVTS